MTQQHLFPDAHAFAGWLKEGKGRWRRVVAAGSWGGCWHALLRVEAGAASAERVVLPAGRRPCRPAARPCTRAAAAVG